MQEIDKLKLILFNKNQRAAFDTIPKINIKESISEDKNPLNAGNLLKKKEEMIIEMKRKTIEGKFNLDTNDPVNKRLMNLVKPEFKSFLISSVLKGIL